MLALEHQVLVDLVGHCDEVVLDAELGDDLELRAENTLPVGLCGEFSKSTRVRGVMARASSSGSNV